MTELYRTFSKMVMVKIFLDYESLANDVTKDTVNYIFVSTN